MEILQKNNAIIYTKNISSSLKNEDCSNALKRIFPRININNIEKIIDQTPAISNIRKEIYKKIIKLRCEKILKYSYEKIK